MKIVKGSQRIRIMSLDNIHTMQWLLLAIAIVLMLVRVDCAPTQAKKSKCPSLSRKKLLLALGASRTQLQAYSPLPLCRGSTLAPEQLQSNDYNDLKNSPPPTANTWHDSAGFGNLPLDTVPGCSAADISQLMVQQPQPGSNCPWRIQCDYDPDRFPSLLYKAVQPNDNLWQVACACKPIQRVAWVLRRVSVNGCNVWSTEVSRELLTVGYNCNLV